ncbi:MAG: Trm112 family protein, partial [Acidobacteriota bacterium]|nr:Trm112 family protein [Acidobacteriota bacterium]
DLSRDPETRMPVDPVLLEMLVCPACRGDLRPTSPPEGLECVVCGRIYPVRDGIPVLLVDESTPPTRDADP